MAITFTVRIIFHGQTQIYRWAVAPTGGNVRI
jgi:hypothetical protein